MKPALTPEQWGAWSGTWSVVLPNGTECDADQDIATGDILVNSSPDSATTIAAGDRYAVAALALYGEPRALTTDDAAFLHLIWQKSPDPEFKERLERIIEKIDGLLPPEKAPESGSVVLAVDPSWSTPD